METRIPDPIERGEMRMESWAQESLKGDVFICPGCNEECPIDDAVMVSPDPYSPPACPECAEDYFGDAA